MSNLFNPDNKFFTFMGRVADLMILNILCIICCIPVITVGPAITAMFYVTLKMARNEESYVIRGFFHSFKQNFRQGVIIHLIMLVVGAVLLFDLYFTRQMSVYGSGLYFHGRHRSLSDGFYLCLSHAGQILQHDQELFPQRAAGIDPAPAVYGPDALNYRGAGNSDVFCTADRSLCNIILHTAGVLHHCLYQLPVLRKNL